MKKRIFAVYAVILVLLIAMVFSACGFNENTYHSTDAPYGTENETPESESADISESGRTENPGSDSGETAENTSIDEVLAHYKELYSAEYDYEDLFLPERHLLIGDQYVVELFLMSGFSQTVVLERKNIERVENTSLSEFAVVIIFDKTNQSISITVKTAEGTEIEEVLR